jgi:hypothetical protein
MWVVGAAGCQAGLRNRSAQLTTVNPCRTLETISKRAGGAAYQRCFLAMVAVKSGALFATQSTNLRTLGLASRPSTSTP